MKNQIVTILHLRKEKPVLATGRVTFALFEKWSPDRRAIFGRNSKDRAQSKNPPAPEAFVADCSGGMRWNIA
jgi:hypothetical protein